MTDPITRDWTQEQLETQEHREAVDKLGRFIQDRSLMAAAHQTVGAMWLAMQILEDGPRSGVIPATRAARLLKEGGGPVMMIRTPIPPEGEPKRPRPTREQILACYRAVFEVGQTPAGPPLYEQFALEVLERWGQ